jgi:hypothetical protein
MRIKQILGHPDYCVSDTGKVFSIKPNGLVELQKDISNKYPRVQMDGEKFYVSSIVAATYLSPPKDTKQKIFFIDGDKTNCSVDNLCWLSPSDVQRYSQYTVEYRRQFLGEW